MSTTTSFTTAAFVRSHGQEPSRSTIGTWAFQAVTGRFAFEADRVGEPWFAPCALTLSEAKKAARQHFGNALTIAVLP